MPQNDFYTTIEAPARAAELKIKGSRFIADILPVIAKSDIEHALDKIRNEFHDATHHCFAYRLGAESLLVRATDNGEPSGTAGKPILLTLTTNQLTDVLLIVTRYYGGTNLGTGGLARAYAESAAMAVGQAVRKTIYLTTYFALTIPYEDLQMAERLVSAFEGTVLQKTYLERPTLHLRIRNSYADRFRTAVTGTFHGKAILDEDEANSPSP